MNKPVNTGEDHSSDGQYPGFFARFYDLIYHHVRDGVDNNFYLNKIIKTNGKILEVGTGTGRLLIEALEIGADIYGIDISSSMLDILKVKLNEEQKHRISLQNIVDFTSGFKYDLIIAPFRVFMHLIEKRDQLKALNNAYHNLNPGGEFIFDAFVPDLKMLITGLDKMKDFDEEYETGNRVRRIVSTKPDLMNQIINVTFTIEWNEGTSNFSREWNTPMRYFFRYELEHLVERSQFEEYNIAGDFYGNPLCPASNEFIVTCRRTR